MRQAGRDIGLIDARVRRDPRANALFLDVLTSTRDAETVLRWMNEAGVFGRFIPDFGRVVAQMQYDMYHHYTVDEHSIRAIGLLGKIERGELDDDHPLSSAIMRKVVSRRALYVSVLLHDIAKGRGGDQIGRAHVCTPVTNAHLVCRLLLEKKKQNNKAHKNYITHAYK